jgi:hypothetical protein
VKRDGLSKESGQMSIRMSRLLLWVPLVLSSAALGQSDTARARAIFAAAAARLETFVSLSAEIELGGSAQGVFDQTISTGVGTLKMIPIEGSVPGRGGTMMTRIDASYKRTRNSEPVELSVLGAPTRVLWTDPERRVVVRRQAKNGVGNPGAGAATMMMPELHAQRPFARELKAEGYTFEGQQRVGDELCDVILVDYGETPMEPLRGLAVESFEVPEARWYMSVEDRFPRKVERLGDYAITQVHTMTGVVWDDPLLEIDLELEAPEGWSYDGLRIQIGRAHV